MKMRHRNVSISEFATLGVSLAVVLSLSGSVRANEPTPTPAAKKTPIVISNENLSEYAAKGRLTTESSASAKTGQRPVHKNAGSSGKTVQDGVADAQQLAGEDRKRYWQERYQQQLNLVGSIEEQIGILDYEIPGLWRDFYSRDDPAYRDGVIKVKLDEALARSGRLEEQLKEEQEGLDQIRSQARKDGAQPGWFRGMEKPTPRPREEESTPANGVKVLD